MRGRTWVGLALATVLVAGACNEEVPTGVGGGLLPPGGIRTFEVVLEPERWLVSDTAFGLYSAVPDENFFILADKFDDALDSRALVRFLVPAVSARDTATNATRTDTLPNYFAGRMVLLIDTLQSAPPPVTIALYRTTEEWHGLSATWALAVDSGAVTVPWSVPGGAPGQLIDRVTWDGTRADTVELQVDSATMVLWREAQDPGRGALIVAETDGARVRTTLPLLSADARPSFRPDTVVTVTLSPTSRTFIHNPAAPDSAAEPRVGGTPTWRAMFRFRERLDTVTVACPGDPFCRVPLSQLTINRAAVQLRPMPTAQGLAPEGPLSMTAHVVLPASTIPLHRWPLTEAVAATTQPIPVSSFMAPDAPVVEIALTDLIIALARPPADEFRPPWFALLPAGPRTFGHGTFAEMPTLRLTLSFARNLQLP